MLDEKASFPIFIALKVLHISEPGALSLFYSKTTHPRQIFLHIHCLPARSSNIWSVKCRDPHRGAANWKIMILQVTAQKFLEESGGQRAGEMVQQIKEVTKVLASQV